MIRKLFVLLFVFLMLFVITSCDIADIPFADDNRDDGKHSHSYTQFGSDTESHFKICDCGEISDKQSHADNGFDGICDYCNYVVRSLLTVTVVGDDNVNITAYEYLVMRGESLTFNVSVGKKYSLTVSEAQQSSSESYGELTIYTLYLDNVERDTTVILSAEPVVCMHDWLSATCTEPSKCTVCGETDGEATGHKMSAATCTEPSTCTVCGLTEGGTLSHIYSVTTVTEPTCTSGGYNRHTCVCGITYLSVIKPLGHVGGEPTYTTEGTCKICNERYLPMLKLTYSSYGAVGDGITDDFNAIKATHEFANLMGITVYADEGKTYNLGQHNDVITIKTDTVWDGATFIIDDREIEPQTPIRTAKVFNVAPDMKPYDVTVTGGLLAGQENIGLTFKTPVLLYIGNSYVKQYIRYGLNSNSGSDQQELILVDENGNVDSSTPIMWVYDVVTRAVAYPVGDTPITLSGGTFITRANKAPRLYTYYARNIVINRSNVTVNGLTHLITDEGETGAPYSGFITVSYCNNVLIENTVFTGHKVYKLSTNENNSMGTYDISLNSANKITLKNCRQPNSIHDTAYWGVMGSNFCKNLTYDGCIFSRFDAHQGTYNATIINSEIGHQKLSVIGKGTLYIENTVFHSDTVVALRTDYGSTWDGEIIFKNITLNNVGTPILVNAGWNNHYFGYTCHLPERIVVDGITLANKDYFYVLPKLYPDIDKATVDGVENKNPVELTEQIVIASNPNGYKYYVSVNTELFSGVEVVVQ